MLMQSPRLRRIPAGNHRKWYALQTQSEQHASRLFQFRNAKTNSTYLIHEDYSHAMDTRWHQRRH
jgi:hypothetical protein